MASKSSYLRTALVKAALKNTAFTGPATVYMSLHTADPGLTGANEITGNAYARTVWSPGAESNGQVQNNASVTFPGPTPANWGVATHMGLWDAASAGNLLYYGPLTNPVTTSIGVPVTFPASNVGVIES
jgi:hypothetical protein